MEFKEVGNKVEKTFKKNGKLIVALVFGGVVLLLGTQKKKGTTYAVEDTEGADFVGVNGSLSSYPDAVTNADVIMSNMQHNLDELLSLIQKDTSEKFGSMQESMDHQYKELQDEFERQQNDMMGKLEESNGFWQDGMENLKDMMDMNNSELMDYIKNNAGNTYVTNHYTSSSGTGTTYNSNSGNLIGVKPGSSADNRGVNSPLVGNSTTSSSSSWGNLPSTNHSSGTGGSIGSSSSSSNLKPGTGSSSGSSNLTGGGNRTGSGAFSGGSSTGSGSFSSSSSSGGLIKGGR